MVVPRQRSFKSIDPARIQFVHFIEVVNPVGAQSCSISDELTPNGPAQAIFQRNILNRIRSNHSEKEFTPDCARMKEGEAGELRIANCGFVPGSPAGELRIANFELRIWAQLAVSKRFFKL